MRSIFWPTPIAAATLAVGWLLASGCAAPGPTAKEQAETAWNGQRAKLKYELASAELQKGRTDEALSLAQGAVGLSPSEPSHAELLARVYMAKGEFAAARDVLLTAQRSSPDTANLAYLLGTIHEREQRWPAAIESFREAATLRPDVLSYRLALAGALAQAGDVQAAIGELPSEHERFSGEPDYHTARADLQRRAGNLSAACEAYERVLGLGGRDPATRAALGLCLFWLGRNEDALPYLEAAARAETEVDPAVMTAYTSALLATGQPEQAAEWLARFTAVRPERGELWLLLAQARLARNDLKGAVQAGDRALTLLPKLCEALCVVAAVRLAAGQAERAEGCVKKALELDPKNAEALLLKGRLCEQRGDRAGATAAFRAVLEQEPANGLAREMLAAVEDGSTRAVHSRESLP